MTSAYKESVNAFLKCKSIAVAGYSTEKTQPANYIYSRFNENGYKVYAVNPKKELIKDVPCYASLKDISEPLDGVVLCTPPSAAEEIVEQCIDLHIKNVWMHRSVDNGSFNKKAYNLCQDHGINCITIGCPLMFVNADFGHKCIKWVLNITGKLKN